MSDTALFNPGVATPAPIVVGVDGSECSKRALRWGAYLAALHGTELDAVGIGEPIAPVGYGWNFVGIPWDRRDEVEKAVSATLDDVFGADRPVEMHVRALEGDPAGLLRATRPGCGASPGRARPQPSLVAGLADGAASGVASPRHLPSRHE